MKPLVQYQIDTDLTQDEVRALWRKYLRKDTYWHFFHEGSYSLIRCSEKNVGLESWLALKKKVKFSIGKWQDPHEQVRKYQEQFEPMFHAFTILGLTATSDEYPRILNRVAHCFSNMSGRQMMAEVADAFGHAMGQLLNTMVFTYNSVGTMVNKLSMDVEMLKCRNYSDTKKKP